MDRYACRAGMGIWVGRLYHNLLAHDQEMLKAGGKLGVESFMEARQMLINGRKWRVENGMDISVYTHKWIRDGHIGEVKVLDYVQHDSLKDFNNSLFVAEELIAMMMENKRSPCTVDPGNLTSLTSKRQKANLTISTKERKEKFGERIVALQQLVSPYGKTDTASVLNEAMEYICFLQEQVKVLSAPYLQSNPTPTKMEELEHYSLRSKGLCLVPISCTAGVAQSNGADIWAPIKTTSSPKFENSSQFH
ncbi:hypothetical protein ACFE04_006857 [Oxalis oulophora]